MIYQDMILLDALPTCFLENLNQLSVVRGSHISLEKVFSY